MLKERQKSILEAIVEGYVKTARPIASHDIPGSIGSPATIRNEMLELDERGYLAQPYTSAGRIPTDKGYRFFVDHLLSRMELMEREARDLHRAFAIWDEDEFVREFSRAVSRISGSFAAAGLDQDDMFYESGFSEILEEPEFREPEYIRMFGHLADFLEEEIREMRQDSKTRGAQLFIGEENPLKEARSFSMVVSSWKHPKGFEGFLTVIAPRRTNYAKHFAIIKAIVSES